MNILDGRITIEKRHSDINGELTVVQDIFMGTYILGGGLPQSGGLAKTIWRHTLSSINVDQFNVKKCLILGLGGGGIVDLVLKKWPDADITGIDIDPVIVELGMKHLKLDKNKVDIHITDAEKFIKECNAAYDLICVDTYVGDEFPEKFTTEKFVNEIRKLLTSKGKAIFNRLYGPEDRNDALKFGKTLEKVFPNVDRVYPEANIMFICSVGD